MKSLDKIKDWFKSLSTFKKLLVVFGVIILIALSINDRGSLSDYESALSVMKKKEWIFVKDPKNHSFLDELRVNFTNDSSFTLTFNSQQCGELKAEGNYSIKWVDYNEDYASPEKLKEKLKNSYITSKGYVLSMKTKFVSVNGTNNNKYIESGSLSVYADYNVIDGYHYSTKDHLNYIIIEFDKNKNPVALHIPFIYTVHKGYGSNGSNEWKVITLQ